jgi:integrase
VPLDPGREWSYDARMSGERTEAARRAASPVRRPRGTGSLLVRTDRAGRETWYVKYRVGDRQVMRRLGLRRRPGERVGQTGAQAEAELRRLIGEETAQPVQERLDLEQLAPRYLAHKRTIGLRRSTVNDYEGMLRVHRLPFFGGRSLDRVTPADVESYICAKAHERKSQRTIAHHLDLLSAMYRYAVTRGLARVNPVERAGRPRVQAVDADIRYLRVDELEAVLGNVADDDLGRTDQVLYLTAALTGLRRGELVALRWRDVDTQSCVVRVRRSYRDRGFGPPKSRRSSRAVPMAERVASELARHHAGSRFAGDDDLVFCHPQLGSVYDPSKLRKRFAAACKEAGVRAARFHDLRQTYGTQMAAAGAPLRALQEWMGHNDYRTTAIYAGAFAQALARRRGL